MADDKQRIELAKWTLERTLAWIASADVKCGVVVTLNIAILGGLAGAFGASAPSDRTTWCYLWIVVATATLISGTFCAAMAAIPRTFGPVKSMIFFGRIAEQREDDYIDHFRQLEERDVLADLATQIHRNSQIARDKHRWIRRAMGWSFLGAIPWAIAIALLVKT